MTVTFWSPWRCWVLLLPFFAVFCLCWLCFGPGDLGRLSLLSVVLCPMHDLGHVRFKSDFQRKKEKKEMEGGGVAMLVVFLLSSCIGVGAFLGAAVTACTCSVVTEWLHTALGDLRIVTGRRLYHWSTTTDEKGGWGLREILFFNAGKPPAAAFCRRSPGASPGCLWLAGLVSPCLLRVFFLGRLDDC